MPNFSRCLEVKITACFGRGENRTGKEGEMLRKDGIKDGGMV